jgi:hypothetical protein
LRFLVKVRVNPAAMAEFGTMLQNGKLDRSCIRGETFCVKTDPAVGYSVWEAQNKEEFEGKFNPWRKYYLETEINEVVSPNEAMALLMAKMK